MNRCPSDGVAFGHVSALGGGLLRVGVVHVRWPLRRCAATAPGVVRTVVEDWASLHVPEVLAATRGAEGALIFQHADRFGVWG